MLVKKLYWCIYDIYLNIEMVVRIISSWSILIKFNEFDLEGNFVVVKWFIDVYNLNN